MTRNGRRAAIGQPDDAVPGLVRPLRFAACGPRAGRRRPQGRSIGVVRPRRLASVGRRRDAGGGQVPRGRTATVEPQVNDRPDQRSVLGPRRFWRAGRRFRRWPSQSWSHSTGSGRRGRATAGQRRLYPSGSPRFLVAWTPVPRPSAFPAFDAAVLGLPVAPPWYARDVLRDGRDPGQAGGQGAHREAAQGRARSVNVREQVPFGPAVSAPSSRWHLAGTQRLGEIPTERPARNLEEHRVTGCTLEVHGPVAE